MTGMSGVWKVRAAVCSSLSRPWPCFCPSCLATLRERCDKLSAVEMKEEEKKTVLWKLWRGCALESLQVASGAGLVMMRRVSVAELMTMGPWAIAPQRALGMYGQYNSSWGYTVHCRVSEFNACESRYVVHGVCILPPPTHSTGAIATQ
jgi:hypothetical protein